MTYSGMVRFVLLDWDNTLVDSWTTIQIAYNATYADYGMPTVTQEEIKKIARQSARDLFVHLFGAEKAPMAITRYRDHYQRLRGEPKPLPNARKMLQYLKDNNIPAGIISNKTHHLLIDEIAALRWQDFFPLGVMGSTKAAYDKPDARTFSAFAHDISVSGLLRAENGVYFGDNAIDVTFARACGLGSVIIGNNLLAEEPQPDFQYPDWHICLADIPHGIVW